jgi:hypothetical protein
MTHESDRELLELAAKAAGLAVIECYGDIEADGGFWLMVEPRGPNLGWNPLTDDGDALRLAVSVKMNLWIYHDGVEVNTDEDPETYNEGNWEDVASATRRAIVRAAAAVGKQQPG